MTSNSTILKEQSEIIQKLTFTKGLSISSLLTLCIPATYCL